MKQVMLLTRVNGRQGQPSGKLATVDNDDYPLVAAHKWNLMDGYAATKIDGKTVRMHRLILGVTDPDQLVDHENRDRLDNRRSNLRLAGRLLNARNAKVREDSTSGHRGVSQLSNGRWRAGLHLHRQEADIPRLFPDQGRSR